MSSNGARDRAAEDAATRVAPALTQKPTRPLTAYHLFFQLEREYILQTTTGKDDAVVSPPTKDERPIGKQIDDDMPFRYRYIHLSPHWYASGSGKRIKNGKNQAKRKHRRTHGKISFLDLSKCIAERWAQLEERDNTTKMYVQKIASRELDIYKREMKLFKANTPPAELLNSCLSGDATASTVYLPPKTASAPIPETGPPSSSKSVKFCGSVKFTSERNSRQASQSKQDDANSSNGTGIGNPEFSFHPVPSSFWRKRKKNAKNGKIQTSNSKVPCHAPYSSTRYKSMPSTSPHHSSAKDMEYIRSNFDKHRRDYTSLRMNFESEVDSFLCRVAGDNENANAPDPSGGVVDGSSHVPVEFTPDDAMGLMQALCGDH